MLHTRLMEPPSTPKLTANRSNRSTSSLLGWISVRWGTEGEEGELHVRLRAVGGTFPECPGFRPADYN